VTDAALPQDMACAHDDVVRSEARRFVDDEQSIHASHFRLPIADWRCENPCAMTTDELRRRTFERAIKLLTVRPRSVAELRDRLMRGKGAKKSIVETVISRLREYGYLDDERFAFSYASSKVKQRPVGKRRLKYDLKLKKVNSNVAEQALELVYAETPEEQLIDRAIEKRVRLRGRPKNRVEAKSLFDHLLRQGFAFELVSEKVRSLATDYTDDPDGC
jgi:regulatory protein